MAEKKPIYKVIFVQDQDVFEVYARYINEDSLMGFIELEELVFAHPESIVIDPSQERLESEFANVKRTYIPMYTVLRIDEVSQEGISKIKPSDGSRDNISHFPKSFNFERTEHD